MAGTRPSSAEVLALGDGVAGAMSAPSAFEARGLGRSPGMPGAGPLRRLGVIGFGGCGPRGRTAPHRAPAAGTSGRSRRVARAVAA